MPRSSARAAEVLGRDRVHLPVGLGIELGRRVVAQAGQVDHAVDVVERRCRGCRARRRRPARSGRGRSASDSSPKYRRSSTRTRYPRVEQPRDEHGADVAGAAGDEDPLPRVRRFGSEAVTSLIICVECLTVPVGVMVPSDVVRGVGCVHDRLNGLGEAFLP